MAFRDLTPSIGHTVPNAKLMVRLLKGGDVLVWLSVSDHFYEKLDKKKRGTVRVSYDDEEHKLRITCEPNAPFKWTEFKKGGARLTLPMLWDDMDEMQATALKVEAADANGFTVILPNLSIIAQKAPYRPTSEPTNNLTKQPSYNGPLDMVAYLISKGYKKTSKLAGDWYQVDGERVSKPVILAIVNKIRKNAELSALNLDQVK